MKRIRLITTIVVCFIASVLSAQDVPKNSVHLFVGANGSWWRYNRGVGQGWDRSDFASFYTLDLGYHRTIKSWEVGLVFTYGGMREKLIEEFDDVPFARSRVPVADKAIRFYQIGLEGLNVLITSPKYRLLAGGGLGTFHIDTVYPRADQFGAKIYWTALVKQQFLLKKNFRFSLKTSYQKKHIFVREGLDQEHHDIIRMGIELGIEKYF